LSRVLLVPVESATTSILVEGTVMTRRSVFAALILVAAIATGASAALAQEVIPVFPMAQEQVQAKSGDQLLVFWFWVANTKGQVRVFLGHTSTTLELLGSDGEPVWSLTPEQARSLYGPVETLPADNSVLDCRKPTYSQTYWEFVTPPLDEGEYTLVLTQSYDQPVNDGTVTCRWVETGERYVQPPGLYRGTYTYVTEIEVLP
jgi:hypothetical protein